MKMIKPTKPIFFELLDLESAIFLTEKEVDISKIKAKAIAEGFREQTERHITIIGGQAILIQNRLKAMGDQKCAQLTKKIIELTQKFDWKFRPGQVFKIAKEGCFGKGSSTIEKRESYIRAIEVPDMELFYKEINNLLNLNIPTQFPHITLFTRGERPNADWQGIPVPSKEVFDFMNPIQIDE